MKAPKKLGLWEDWAMVPSIAAIILGTIISVYDFAALQSRSFWWTSLTFTEALSIASALLKM